MKLWIITYIKKHGYDGQNADLSEQFVMTVQKLKEQLQKTRGADQIFISQKDEGFTERLRKS